MSWYTRKQSWAQILIEMYQIVWRWCFTSLIHRSRAVSKRANVFLLCVFNAGLLHSGVLADSCINMSWPFGSLLT